MKFIDLDNLKKFWSQLNLYKQDKLPEGETGQVLTKTNDGVEWLFQNECNCAELTNEELLEIFGIQESEDNFVILVGGEKVSNGHVVNFNANGGSIKLGLQINDDVSDLLQYKITGLRSSTSWISCNLNNANPITVENRRTNEGDVRTGNVDVIVNDKFTISLTINQEENKILSTESMTKTVDLGQFLISEEDFVMYSQFPDYTVSIKATFTSGSTGTVNYSLMDIEDDQFPDGAVCKYSPEGDCGPDGITVHLNNSNSLRILEYTVTLTLKDGTTGTVIFRIWQEGYSGEIY